MREIALRQHKQPRAGTKITAAHQLCPGNLPPRTYSYHGPGPIPPGVRPCEKCGLETLRFAVVRRLDAPVAFAAAGAQLRKVLPDLRLLP
jgi:hypothetical protein